MMDQTFEVGTLGGLKITYDYSAIAGFIGTWILLAAIGAGLVDLAIGAAVVAGLIGAAIHFFMEYLHQIGHSMAARRTGHPMTGVHFFLLLGRSIYPADEGELPPATHIRRALGGPSFSLWVSVVIAILIIIVNPAEGMVWFVLGFALLDSFLVFTIGSLMPLGFTDGSTLLKYMRK